MTKTSITKTKSESLLYYCFFLYFIFNLSNNNESIIPKALASSGNDGGFPPLGVHFPHGYNQQKSSFVSDASRTSTSFHRQRQHKQDVVFFLPRGGGNGRNNSPLSPSSSAESLTRIIGTTTQILISCGNLVLPPIAIGASTIVKFYRALPMDAITAQIGLVYCFLGGYYPTLFSSLQAAKYCGWSIMVAAITDLTEEALHVIDEVEQSSSKDSDGRNRKDLFLRQTNIVLKTVDPIKINQAVGALYTTWLGVSTILRQEYARVINLSLTLASGIERVSYFILHMPLQMITPKDYSRWPPVIISWISKGVAIRIAWRIQRVLTASTSAIAGGTMFAQSIMRMIRNRNNKKKKKGRRKTNQAVVEVDDNDENDTDNENVGITTTSLENMIALIVGGIGFYTQIDYQAKNNFSFDIPFPINLVTWPFDIAEKWIQWYITEN